MASTAILRSHRHHRFLLTSRVHFISSSSSNSDENNQHPKSQSSFNDVKSSLKHTPPSPQHNPSFHTPNPNSTKKIPPLEDIRKNLSNFRRQPPSRVPSFQELYQKNVAPKPDSGSETRGVNSLEAIRRSLKSIRPSLSQSQSQPKASIGMDDIGLKLKPRPTSLNEMAANNKGGEVSDETKSEFVRVYSYGEMGEKLRRLRPGNKNVGFSLEELSQRLRMVREMEEKEIKRGAYGPLRDSLLKIQDQEKAKKNVVSKISVLPMIRGTASLSLDPPKEVLVEKYFHPDHMPSAEKQKLVLKNVRDKFKISESDCGSSRVQGDKSPVG